MEQWPVPPTQCDHTRQLLHLEQQRADSFPHSKSSAGELVVVSSRTVHRSTPFDSSLPSIATRIFCLFLLQHSPISSHTRALPTSMSIISTTANHSSFSSNLSSYFKHSKSFIQPFPCKRDTTLKPWLSPRQWGGWNKYDAPTRRCNFLYVWTFLSHERSRRLLITDDFDISSCRHQYFVIYEQKSL